MTAHLGELWIGLVELSGPSTNAILQGAAGAYSTYLLSCNGSAEFQAAATESASLLGLVVEAVKWSEPYNARLSRYDIEDYLVELAALARKDHAGHWGRFHTWDHGEP